MLEMSRLRWIFCTVLLGVATWGQSSATVAAETDAAAAKVSVEKTYNDRPFEYTMELFLSHGGVRVYRLSYPSPMVTPVKQNNTVPAEYYLPEGITPGDPKRPAVICLHILNGNFELVRMLCTALATRGIPALMFKMPYYGERGLPGGRDALAEDPRLFVEALRQATEDVRRTVDLLASRPEVDADKIGIAGISLGAIQAATAAGQEPRLARAALILGGGDLEQVIDHAREARDLRDVLKTLPAEQRAQIVGAIRAIDPLRHAPGLRDRARQGRVLMVNARKDNVIPPACTEKLAAELGIADRVVWLEGLNHYTALAALPRVLRTTTDFFAADLPDGTETPSDQKQPPKHPEPAEVIVSVLKQATTFVTAEPKQGRCHLLTLKAKATLKDGDKVEGRLAFIRGTGYQFKLEATLPEIGEVAMGQGKYPWMLSGEKIAFRGRKNSAGEPRDPLALADPEYVTKLRMVAGGMAGVTLAPQILDQWVTFRDDTGDDGIAAVRILPKKPSDTKDHVRLVLGADGKTPASATFDIDGVRGQVEFVRWQLSAPAQEAMFAEPAGVQVQDVDRADLYRMIAAMFNFAMESLE